MDFAKDVAVDNPQYFPRGHEPWETAFTFFRRHADRSIDEINVAARADEVAGFLAEIKLRHGRPALLIGFSSGAIMAAALLAKHPTSTEGTVLLRPEKPFRDKALAQLSGIPVLIVSGEKDPRRKRSDAGLLFDQLTSAGADAEWHDLPCGHSLDPEGGDTTLTRAWLVRRGS